MFDMISLERQAGCEGATVISDVLNLCDYIRMAYKKLKASVYFDKTQLVLLNKIVNFEAAGVEDTLTKLEAKLTGKKELWNNYESGILSKVGTLVYPKELHDCSKEDEDHGDKEEYVIFNMDNEPIKLERAQYFIDLPVEGHILGVLWILTIGLKLDNRDDPDHMNMYEHSYGNRLRKTLLSPKTGIATYSPYLFETYFAQYGSWRDKALDYAKKRLNDKQDAIILTLDFKSFFYSVDVQEEPYNKLLNFVEQPKEWVKRIHNFVYKVLCAYSDIVREKIIDEEFKIGNRTILPIGFLPSNILSNWILTPFDEAVIKRCNPVYYGRYVDDIIFVDKVEKNSPIHKWASANDKRNRLTTQKVLEYYFCYCPDNRTLQPGCKHMLFIPEEESGKEKTDKNDNGKSTCRKKVYQVNNDLFHGTNTNIKIQSKKVKVFYFREGGTQALIDCFQKQIEKNASEFRYMPDLDDVLSKNDYSEIVCLKQKDSIQKLNEVTGIELDKYTLSKFLGKYRKVSAMINDKKENSFDTNILAILGRHTLIQNYTLWERLLEIMIVSNRLDNYKKMIGNMLDAIAVFEIPEDKVKDITSGESDNREALLLSLHAGICRTAALQWGPSMDDTIKEISKMISEKLKSIPLSTETMKSFTVEHIRQSCKNYCSARMVNKYVMPIPIDCLNQDDFEKKHDDICLYKLQDEIGLMQNGWLEADTSYYLYFPYMVTPHEISFAIACQRIHDGELLCDPLEQHEKLEDMYLKWNYNDPAKKARNDADDFALDKIRVAPFHDCGKAGESSTDRNRYAISVDSEPASAKLRVAIGNARLYPKDFQDALKGKANRSYERYQQLSELLHTAVCKNVDLLVLPENYLPWEWMPDITRLCANNQMGLITGIEHIVSPHKEGESRGRSVYNLTAVILPFCQESYKYAHVTYHQKVNYSPEEKRIIAGYRFAPCKGNSYHLFYWRNVWFTVCCCFELASIQGRAMFQSLADLTVAVEWNRDVAYFSNIVESLCRDLHCFCIQANSSDYGDSRVLSPSRTEKRDIIKTKGGQNSAVLIDDLDINALREFQQKEYELQRQDNTFKVTPPDFDTDIPACKQRGKLWEYLEENEFKNES